MPGPDVGFVLHVDLLNDARWHPREKAAFPWLTGSFAVPSVHT